MPSAWCSISSRPGCHSQPTSKNQSDWWARTALEGQVQLGDSAEFTAGVLALDSLLLVGGIAQGNAYLLRAGGKVGLIQVGVLHEGGAPWVSVERFAGDVHSGGRDEGGQELKHGVLLQGALCQVAGQLHHRAVRVRSLQVAAQKGVNGGDGEVKVKRVDDVALHLKNFLLVVRTVRDVDKIAELRWVNLLVLRSNLHLVLRDEKRNRMGRGIKFDKKIYN